MWREHLDVEPVQAARTRVVLQLADNPRFNAWVRRLACKQRRPGQPVVIVRIGKLLPARSRIRSPKLRVEAA